MYGGHMTDLWDRRLSNVYVCVDVWVGGEHTIVFGCAAWQLAVSLLETS